MSVNASKICLSGLPLETAEQLSETLELEHEEVVQACAIDIDDEDKGLWRLEVYGRPDGDPDILLDAVKELVSRQNLPSLQPEIIEIENHDWVAKSQSDLAPVRAGRFFVHGSHDRAHRPPGGISIEIEAAQAFGTGHHATTQGCLIALDHLLKQGGPWHVLDLGCGSGVLAIAAALATRRQVMAGDVDPLAVRIATENAVSNGAGSLFRAVTANGARHRQIAEAAPYDLVFANILARPLEVLAPEVASVLAPGGRAILSGLMVNQEARVLGAYRLQGLHLQNRIRLEGWSTLTLAG